MQVFRSAVAGTDGADQTALLSAENTDRDASHRIELGSEPPKGLWANAGWRERCCACGSVGLVAATALTSAGITALGAQLLKDNDPVWGWVAIALGALGLGSSVGMACFVIGSMPETLRPPEFFGTDDPDGDARVPVLGPFFWFIEEFRGRLPGS